MFLRGVIYKAIEPYDDDLPEYDCYTPNIDADPEELYCFDCWVCNEQGDLHPEFDRSPVPVRTERLGKAVKLYPRFLYC